MADGNEYNVFLLEGIGRADRTRVCHRGTPVVIGNAALLKNAPHPSAGKLFYQFMFTREAQQSNSDIGGLRSFHSEVKEKPGRTPLAQIKLLNSDPAALEGQVETIKKKYEEYFGT
jgi:iron(III) transport system substrate-binding protein